MIKWVIVRKIYADPDSTDVVIYCPSETCFFGNGPYFFGNGPKYPMLFSNSADLEHAIKISVQRTFSEKFLFDSKEEAEDYIEDMKMNGNGFRKAYAAMYFINQPFFE